MADRNALRAFIEERTGHCRVLVVGDVMLDQYYYGEVTRISPEAPVPVTRINRQTNTLGGAANVAHNLSLLGAVTAIGGYVGDDYHGKILFDKFTARGIEYRGLVHTPRPTTTKLRVIGGHQQMLRLDFEEAGPVTGQYADRLMAYIEGRIAMGLDAIVLSDYDKGCLTPDFTQRAISLAHAKELPIIVDPKGGDWHKYQGADYLTPNLKEIREILPYDIKNTDKDVEKAARYVMKNYHIKNLVVTRSEAGLSLITADDAVHIPTVAREVFDVSGAGDTVIAVLSLALAGEITPADAAYLANQAASVVVAKLGTYAVSQKELAQILSAAE